MKGKRVLLTLHPRLIEKLDEACEKKMVSRSVIVTLALTEYLKGVVVP